MEPKYSYISSFSSLFNLYAKTGTDATRLF